jgi:uncharacterized protein (DUF885 family)
LIDRSKRALRALSLLVALACAGAIRAPGPAAAAAAAEPSAAARALDRLCADYWEGVMRAQPTYATNLGDRRFDDRLPDISPAGDAADRKRLTAALERARAIDAQQLDAERRVTRGLLIEELETSLAQMECHFDEWIVDPMNGPQTNLLGLPDELVVRDAKDLRAFAKRCRQMGPYLDQHVANLERGLAAGKTSSIAPVRKTLDQLDRLDTLAVDAWPLFAAVRRARTSGISAADSTAAEREIRKTIVEVVKPAFARYRAFVRDRVLPAARPEDKAGLVALPGGLASYRTMIRAHTSLDKTPHELHELGLAEVAKNREALADLGERALGTRDVAEIQRRLRSDPATHFETAEQVEAKARESLARATRAMDAWFGILPKAACIVKPMGMHEAPQSTIAYYQQPAADGSRPGTYVINTYAPTTRPRYEAEVLAFHESIPGHHLQIAISQELQGLPAFRKFGGTTAFVEGWGLYSERLSAEMGLYSGALDSIGILSFDAWRACRLVVDTGIHALGWSRQQAIDYMIANTVLAPNNIENEVDRYITRPGQALAYKVGQLEILRLREEAKQRLGERFDIKSFHDAVLAHGAVTMPVLEEQVQAWAASREGVLP